MPKFLSLGKRIRMTTYQLSYQRMWGSYSEGALMK